LKELQNFSAKYLLFLELYTEINADKAMYIFLIIIEMELFVEYKMQRAINNYKKKRTFAVCNFNRIV